MRPNIFDIATKELHQDAFITWLLQYADDQCAEDEVLNKCGKHFVKLLIKKQLPEFDEPIRTVKPRRQWKQIDVTVEVNDQYLIIIEDKVSSSEHANQLVRYKEIAEERCVQKGFEKPICIYLKTGNESLSSLKQIVNKGFVTFNRKDFVQLLEQYSISENNIFQDFLSRLQRLERVNKAFESKPIGSWNSDHWQGFFQLLETEMNIVNWHFVNNANRGFWNAVLNWEYWNVFPVYIQIEQGKLCFKISTDAVQMPENMTRGAVRNKFHSRILSSAREQGLSHIKRPKRFGNGKYMTVAMVERQNWLGGDNEVIDIHIVVKQLNGYKQFLKHVIG